MNGRCVFINILQRNLMEGSAYVPVQSGFTTNDQEVAHVPRTPLNPNQGLWERQAKFRYESSLTHQRHTDNPAVSITKPSCTDTNIKNDSDTDMEKKRIQGLYCSISDWYCFPEKECGQKDAHSHIQAPPHTHTRLSNTNLWKIKTRYFDPPCLKIHQVIISLSHLLKAVHCT